MNQNITCSINCNKINETINNLIPVYNLINNTNIYEGIQDLEKEITKINLEHGNCIDNYKDNLKAVSNEIELLQNDLKKLFESLNFVIEIENNGNISDMNHIKKIATYYDNTSVGNNLLNLFKQTNSNISTIIAMNQEKIAQDVNNQFSNNIDNESYNTIPIGLGIAASGISAAAGTVLVDSMYQTDNSKSSEIENLEDYENEEEKQEQDDSKSKYEMDEIPTPYHASRDKIIANKFYEGNEDRNEEYEEI